jgi:hypothetical protein
VTAVEQSLLAEVKSRCLLLEGEATGRGRSDRGDTLLCEENNQSPK